MLILLFPAPSAAQTKPQSHVLPKYVRDYEKNLKEMYIDMIPFLDPDWPESNPQEATRVVLISSNKHETESGYSESESQEHDHARGKIDSILAHKKEVDISTILNPVPSPANPTQLQAPKVLMDGAPGVGKTTLTLNACKDWAENRLFKQYELVLLVPLRQDSCREAKTIEEFLPGDNQTQKAKVVQYIQERQGKNIAFIFDGYDELSYEQRHKSNSLCMKIFRGKTLTKCALWITSRPYTSGELKKQPSIINRHVEVLGFNKGQIYSCIRKRIEDKSSADSLISQLEEREDIASLCYIPLVCIIMIHVYKSQEEKLPDSQSSLPATMTKLVESFILDMLIREVLYVEKNTELEEDDFCDINNLPKSVSDRLDVLDHLAYDFLIKDKFIFTYSELKAVYGGKLSKSTVKSCCLGLLSFTTNISKSAEQHFQFVHLSIQEFLAARYIYRTLKHHDQMDIFCQYIDEPRFRLFMLFFAGMIPLNEQTLKLVFCLGFKKHSGDNEKKSWPSVEENSWAGKLLYYINLIFESQHSDSSYFSCLYHSLPDKSMLNLSNQRLSLFDCRILTHFLCSINKSWESLDLSNCSLTLESIKVMNRVWINCNSELRAPICHVDLSENDPDVINNLQIFPWFNDIQTLKFQNSLRSDFEHKSIHSNLDFLCHIPELCIKQGAGLSVSTTPNNVTLCGVSLGEGLMSYLQGIKELELTDICCSTVNMVMCETFLQALEVLIIQNVANLDLLISQHASRICSSTVLQRLTLLGVGLTSLGALPLLESLKSNSTIQTLDISCNPTLSRGLQCDKIGPALKTLLVTNKTIKELIMGGGTLSEDLAQYLIAGIQRNTALECLVTSQNILTIKTICNLITISLSRTGLSQINVEGIVLKRNGSSWKLQGGSDKEHVQSMKGFSILSKLYDITCLECIPVSYVNINTLETYDHSKTFFQALRNDKHVHTLYFSNVTLDIRFGCAMGTMLTFNNVLRHIHFSKCIIPDSILTHLQAGLSGTCALKTLSLTHAKEVKSIIHILQALQHNNSIEELDLSDNKSLLVGSSSDLAASKFEDLLKSNSVLTKISLHNTYVNDVIALGFARGLTVNNRLRILEVPLSQLSSHGTKEIVNSASESVLANFYVSQLYSLNRNEKCGWELLVDNEYHFWPHLQHLFRDGKRFNLVSFKFDEYSLHAFQIERTLHVLARNARFSLRVLDLFRHGLVMSSVEEFEKAKDIGIALKELLTKCLCLERLTLKQCALPQGTWNYAAKGLSGPSCLLKCLDLSQCAITAREAVSIFKHIKTVEELDLSDNERIKDTNYTSELCEAIKLALSSSYSKIQYLNMKNSINNEVARSIAFVLQMKSNLQTIEISEALLSCDVIQNFLMLMVQDESLLSHLSFTDISFSRSSSQDFWFDTVNKFVDKKVCKSSKLFCGLCSVQLYQPQIDVPLHNVTNIELKDVDHNVLAVLQRSLEGSLLPKLANLTLTIEKNTSNSVAIGQQLKNLIEKGHSLCDLTLYHIDAISLGKLSDGLISTQCLKTLKVVIIDLESFISNKNSLAKLLRAVESNKSLMTLCIYKLPIVRRRSVHSDWHLDMSQNEYMPFDRTEGKSYPLLPRLICSLTDVCNDHTCSLRSAESILSSIPDLKLHSSCDISLVTKLFRCLASNHILRELDLSRNQKIAKNCDESMCQAIELFLSTNISVEVLNMSGSLNNTIASALIEGLKKNQIPRHLHVDVKSLEISTLCKMVHFLEIHSLKCLTVTDVFVVNHFKNLEWHIRIIDQLLWSQLLPALMIKSLSENQLWITFRKLTDIGCLYVGSPLLFDTACERMHFQLPLSIDGLSTVESYILPKSDAIKHYLINTTALKGLILSGCNLSDEGCGEIASGLAVTPQLTKLDISANVINDSGIVTLCQVLQRLPALEELNISFNRLSCNCEYLGPAIKTFMGSNETIKRLILKSCNLSNLICKFIGLAMKTNCSLTFLDVSNNKITSVGARTLLKSLKYNSNIVNELDLSGNCIFDGIYDIGQTLERVLASNKHLATLNLNSAVANNDFIFREILAGLERNKTLQELTLDFSQCSSQSLDTFLSKSNLMRINHSDSFSFIRMDTGWKIELSRTTETFFNKYLSQTSLNIREIIASNSTAPALIVDFDLQQMIGPLIASLKNNNTLKSLSVQLNRDSQCNSEPLGNAMKQMVEMNSTIKDLNLSGYVSDGIVKGIIVGLKSNRKSSIKCLSVETSHLSIDSITCLMEMFNETDILLKISFNPRALLFSKSTFYGMEMVKTYDVCNSSTEIITCTYLEDALAISLFALLQRSTCHVTSLDLSSNTQLVQSGESVNQALEKMLIGNKTINTLTFGYSVNDSMLKSIAKGMRRNQNVHIMSIAISGISDEALGSLLLSLSNSPLTVKVEDGVVHFMRSVSKTNSMDKSGKHIPTISSPFRLQRKVYYSKLPSTELRRIFDCMSGSLKEFEFSYSAKHLPTEMIMFDDVTISSYLTRIKTLQTLKMCNPVTGDVIRELIVGFKGNKTLNYLALHAETLKVNDFAPIFETLQASSITKLEIIDELFFFRDKGSAHWKLEIIKYDLLMVLPTAYKALSKLLRTTGIEITTIIDKYIRNMKLIFPDSDDWLTLLILKSMEEGNYLVRKLDLVFNTGINEPHEFGKAIERMLKSCKSLKMITIMNLRNDTIASHLVAGLAQSTSLSQLCVKEQYLCNSSFVQSLLKVHLVGPSIHKICICDDISLQRKVHHDPWKDLESKTFSESIADSFSETMMMTLGIESHAHEETDRNIDLPKDGSWRVMPIHQKSLVLSIFCLLNKTMSNICTTSIGGLILEYLRNLDLSKARLNCKQLASLFEELQENSTVINLDVSFSVREMPNNQDLDMHCTLRGMLERNKTIKVLNLRGIVDDKVAIVLASALHLCSLTSLSVNFSTKDYCFNRLEDLLSSFLCSKTLLQLELADFCVLQKKESVIHINAFTTTQYQFLEMSSKVELLQSWCILFLFCVLTKHASVSGLGITMSKHSNNGLMNKVFRLFFSAVREDIGTFSASAAEDFVASLEELHLDITVQSCPLFSIMIGAFRNLKRLHLSHDAKCSENPALALSYKALISSNETLKLIRFNGQFKDMFANALAEGLIHNGTLHTLDFSADLLSVETLTHLFKSVCDSALICVHINEGCCLKRAERKQSFNIKFTGNKALLCKLFCASIRVKPENNTFLTPSPFICKDLDLSNDDLSSNAETGIDFLSLFATTSEGFISTLVLTRNKVILDQYFLMSSTSVLKELRLDACSIKDCDCEQIAMGLATNKCLEVLDLHSNVITSYGATSILSSVTKNDTLQFLDLSNNSLSQVKVPITNSLDIIKQPSNKNALLTLNVGLFNPLCLDVTSALHAYTSLKKLSFQIKEEELLAKIIYFLKDNQMLEELDITESPVKTSAMGLAIQQLLECSHSIKSLNMSSCDISDDTCVLFLKGLIKNTHLEKLNLSGNSICGIGILNIFEILEGNTCSLEELNLSSNWEFQRLSSIPQDQIESVTILSTNSTLRTLLVSEFCCFNEWFGIKLFEGLKHNGTLCKLDMSDNRVGVDTFNEFISMLSENSTLCELNIRWDDFPVCDDSLVEALLQCSSLKKLTVDPVIDGLLMHKDQLLSKGIDIVKSVGGGFSQYMYYKE